MICLALIFTSNKNCQYLPTMKKKNFQEIFKLVFHKIVKHKEHLIDEHKNENTSIKIIKVKIKFLKIIKIFTSSV